MQFAKARVMLGRLESTTTTATATTAVLHHCHQFRSRDRIAVQCYATISMGQLPHRAVNTYPYPTNPRPTPNQIFHLPIGASEKDVKSRYYDLVRIYHPDSLHSRISNVSQKVREERFRSITDAYDILRGKKSGGRRYAERDWGIKDELERRRRRQRAEEVHQDVYGSGWTAASPDDRDKDRFLIAVGVLCLAVAVGPTFIWSHRSHLEERHLSASANLAQARKEAREFGQERRAGIRKRVVEFKEDRGPKPEEVRDNTR